ncbi:glycosyltransferase family 2 protein [Cohnella sp. GCM10020058]|uniref:glycosyltransferase family 2 protein n=1 Tax=Cohnella sp. GCM10020058 TaxID=3317330 RepID=UPI00362F2029
MKVSVFTPTYNRAATLLRCYYSLCSQTSKSFEWIIVDDGSTDNTEELVNAWIFEEKIKISYFKQLNQGKHKAFNVGVEKAEGELFFCLDSDDSLVEEAIEQIINGWSEDCQIVGLIFCKGNMDGSMLGSELPSVNNSTVEDLYFKHKVKGDKLMVFCTERIVNVPYPIIENETFITEAYLYDILDVHYKWKLINKMIYLVEYQADGYSARAIELLIKNPKGYALFFRNRVMRSRSKVNFQTYLNAARYINCCFISRDMIWFPGLSKSILIISFPLALMLYTFKYRKKN